MRFLFICIASFLSSMFSAWSEERVDVLDTIEACIVVGGLAAAGGTEIYGILTHQDRSDEVFQERRKALLENLNRLEQRKQQLESSIEQRQSIINKLAGTHPEGGGDERVVEYLSSIQAKEHSIEQIKNGKVVDDNLLSGLRETTKIISTIEKDPPETVKLYKELMAQIESDKTALKVINSQIDERKANPIYNNETLADLRVAAARKFVSGSGIGVSSQGRMRSIFNPKVDLDQSALRYPALIKCKKIEDVAAHSMNEGRFGKVRTGTRAAAGAIILYAFGKAVVTIGHDLRKATASVNQQDKVKNLAGDQGISSPHTHSSPVVFATVTGEMKK